MKQIWIGTSLIMCVVILLSILYNPSKDKQSSSTKSIKDSATHKVFKHTLITKDSSALKDTLPIK